MIRLRRGLPALLLAVALGLLALPAVSAWLMGGGQAPYPVARLLDLAADHAALALAGVLPAALIGLGLGIVVTRPGGLALRGGVDAAAAVAQAVPPVVVVALAVPAFGFGWAPTVLALMLYGIMPVLRATVGALESVPADARLAAEAVGLSPRQVLAEVELALAWPLVLDGLRVALVLAVATAAVGALAGAATLGTPIVIGLQNQNAVLVLQGAAATASLAFLAEALLLMAVPARE